MSGFYADDIDGAYEDIADAGAMSKLIEPGAKTGPENDPSYGDPTPHDCPAVQSDWSEKERQNAAINVTDTKYIIPAKGLSIRPEAGFQFAFAGRPPARIEGVRTVEPNGTPIVHILQVRS